MKKSSRKLLDYASKVKGKLTAAAALQTANIYSRESKWDDALKALDTIKEDQEPAIVEEAALFKARILLETKGEKNCLRCTECFPDLHALLQGASLRSGHAC